MTAWADFEQFDARRIAALARLDKATAEYAMALFEAMAIADDAAHAFPGKTDFLPPGYSGRGLAKRALGALAHAAPALSLAVPLPAGPLAVVGAEQSALLRNLRAATGA